MMYEMITSIHLDLGQTNPAERKFLKKVEKKFASRPNWSNFRSWWLREFDKAGLDYFGRPCLGRVGETGGVVVQGADVVGHRDVRLADSERAAPILWSGEEKG